MVIFLLILILSVLIYGPDKTINALGTFLSGFLILTILALGGLFYEQIYLEISKFINYIGWQLFSLIVSLVITIFILAIIIMMMRSKKEKLNSQLFNAVLKNDLKVVKILLKKNASPNARDKKNWTPLITAASNGYFEIVNELLKSKAKVNLRNVFGDTAYVHAKYKGFDDIAKLLKKAGAGDSKPSNMVLYSSVDKNNIEGVRRCLKAGASPQAKDHYGESVLEKAIKNENPIIIAYLVKYGALPNLRETRIADQSKNLKVVEIVRTGQHLKIIENYEKGYNQI